MGNADERGRLHELTLERRVGVHPGSDFVADPFDQIDVAVVAHADMTAELGPIARHIFDRSERPVGDDLQHPGDAAQAR